MPRRYPFMNGILTKLMDSSSRVMGRDLIDQESLYKMQDELADIMLQLAQKCGPRRERELAERFPWAFNFSPDSSADDGVGFNSYAGMTSSEVDELESRGFNCGNVCAPDNFEAMVLRYPHNGPTAGWISVYRTGPHDEVWVEYRNELADEAHQDARQFSSFAELLEQMGTVASEAERLFR